MDHRDVQSWVDGYERAWRSPGTDQLTALFTEGAIYVVSPWAEAVRGLEVIGRLWESERAGPDEEFTMTSDVVAVDAPVAVVRVQADYATGNLWRDLWVVRFADDGRCMAFEEWPFAPGQADGH